MKKYIIIILVILIVLFLIKKFVLDKNKTEDETKSRSSKTGATFVKSSEQMQRGSDDDLALKEVKKMGEQFKKAPNKKFKK